MIFSIHPSQKILVVAPHPDDDCIGCGGLLAQYASQCDVWLMTDGERYTDNRPQHGEDYAKIRRMEFENAMEIAGIKHYQCFSIPEGEIIHSFSMVANYNIRDYRYIFVPNRYEIHDDHIATYKLLKRLIKQQRSQAELIEYEVWSPLNNVNVKLDIASVKDKKEEFISCYHSQMQDINYSEMILSLNRYRGLSRGLEYAEMFYSEREDKQQRWKRWKKRFRRIRNFKISTNK